MSLGHKEKALEGNLKEHCRVNKIISGRFPVNALYSDKQNVFGNLLTQFCNLENKMTNHVDCYGGMLYPVK
jgi:hypothetical protein